MASDDYYDILGVSKNATQDEIKKAYRKLARELHPDRNPDNKASEERLKSVNEAYDVLGDPEKRASYDRYGTADFDGINMDGFGSIFDQIFRGFGFGGGGMGRGFSQRGPPQGESLRLRIPLTFEEAFFGVEKEIAITRKTHCTTCNGSGAEPGTSPVRCSTCGGRGQVVRSMGFMQVAQTCPRCQGMGQSIDSPCKKCRGTGLENTKQELKFPLPPGIEDGMMQRIRGGGNAGPRGGPPGDLIIVFSVEEHEQFIRKGLHVFLETDIPYSVAVLGGEIEVPTMWGSSKLKVKKGTQGGTVLRMKEKGVHTNDGRKGDQLVRVEIHVPEKPSKEQKDLLSQLSEMDL